jgi:hypothetical protein
MKKQYCDKIAWSVARQQLGKYVSAATILNSTMEELFEAVFSLPRLYMHIEDEEGGQWSAEQRSLRY